MKNVKNLLWILLLSFQSSCSELPYSIPLISTCIHNKENSAECADLRRPKDHQGFFENNLENYICRTPEDEKLIYDSIQDMRKKLIECESR